MGSGRPGHRGGYADASLAPQGGAWKKYLYTYRIWGRMLYDPDTPREVWGRYLKSQFGPAARDCEMALGRASRVLLTITTAHTPSCSNNGYWPEIHTNIPIDRDLAAMQSESRKAPPAPGEGPALTWRAARSRPGLAAGVRPSHFRCQHLPPATFRRGEPISIELAPEAGFRLASAELHYRHVDQSDAYRTIEMSADGGRFRAEIPGQYTDSPYPMLYYFHLRSAPGAAWIHPGFNPDLANQPYFIVRQA